MYLHRTHSFFSCRVTFWISLPHFLLSLAPPSPSIPLWMQVILSMYLYFFILQQPTVSVGPHCKMALSVPPSLEPAHSPPLPTLLQQSACPLGILSLGLLVCPHQWTTATSCGLLALLPCGCSTAVLTMHLLQRILALSSLLLLQIKLLWQ